jgi:hypothetical protein
MKRRKFTGGSKRSFVTEKFPQAFFRSVLLYLRNLFPSVFNDDQNTEKIEIISKQNFPRKDKFSLIIGNVSAKFSLSNSLSKPFY